MESLVSVCKNLTMLTRKFDNTLIGHIQTSLTNKLLHVDCIQFTKLHLKDILLLNNRIIEYYQLLNEKLKLKIECHGFILIHQLHH